MTKNKAVGASNRGSHDFIFSDSAVAAEEDNESDENDPETAVAAVKKIAKTIHGVTSVEIGGLFAPL